MDFSGTINPADLNSASHPSSNANSPRGSKRPYTSDEQQVGEGDAGDEDDKPRKRGRPFKTNPSVKNESPSTAAQTPQIATTGSDQKSPNQPSPAPKSATATKNIKALPSVRDHTTDQLNPEGDEYIPREVDEAGEKKVTPTGHLTGGRAYKCRTFFVPNRGNKLFMLATECARILNYRDSYLLFNKNRSLYKIIASQPEKDELIHQEILPYAYRSRQIAIVSARSMFRQFGARMIVNGKRVRDDYWEAKARKQGFTEDDVAGEKRPGTTKAKEAAAVELTTNGANAYNTLSRGNVVYQPSQLDTGLGFPGHPPGLPSYPMLSLSLDDLSPRDYGNVQRPRQDPSGIPYVDNIQPSASSEIINQAATAAQYNESLRQQRTVRGGFLNDAWNREHHPDTPPEMVPMLDVSRPGSQPPQQQQFQSPSISQGIASGHQSMGLLQSAQQYARPAHPQNSLTSPIQASMTQSLSQSQQFQRNSNYTYGADTPVAQPMYGYPQSGMWPPQAPSQASPIQHQPPNHQYGTPQYNAPQQTQPRQQASPHPSQSPHHAQPPQFPNMYQNMPGMGHPAQTPGAMAQQGQQAGFQGMRAYGQPPAGVPQQQQQQYMQNPTGQQQAGMPAWMGGGQQGWGGHGYQQ